MSAGLAERQLELIQWTALRASSGTGEKVPDALRTLLTSSDLEAVAHSFRTVEAQVVSQGQLFECTPHAVSVMVAAISESTIPAANLGTVLDVLCMILAGHPDPSEPAADPDLRTQCHEQALRAYWPLMRLSRTIDDYNAYELAGEAVLMLDELHAQAFGEEAGWR